MTTSDMERYLTTARKHMMLQALKSHHGNVRAATREVGVHPTTHYDWMRTDEAYRSMSLQGSFNAMSSRDQIQKTIKNRNAFKRKKINGYVYVIHCEGTTFYKIGISKKNYNDRLYNLQSGCPFELEMIYVSHSDDHRRLEKELHNKFKDKCVRGEWFDLDEASLNTLIKYLEDTHQRQMQAERQMQIDFQGKDHK